MANERDPINDFTELSGSSPQRTRPTDEQMGLGTHNLIIDKAKKKKNRSDIKS